MQARGSYFSVQSWMVQELGLRGAERDVYAIIYGFCQDDDSDFHGSLRYISDITGYSKNSVCTALKSLVDKGYIIKNERTVNNVKLFRYYTSNLDTIQVTCTENDETVQVTCTNNNSINNKKENNKNIRQTPNTAKLFNPITTQVEQVTDYNKFVDLYNTHCFNLPKIVKLTDKRKKAIQNIQKKYSIEDIIKVFDSANNSNFLTGGGDRGWKADIDFILREDKFVNILEGKYGGKGKRSNKGGFVDEAVYKPVTKEEMEEMKKFQEELKANGKQVIF